MLHPYYLINLILSLSFLLLKLTPVVCDGMFSSAGAKAYKLDMCEYEILFFLLVVIMVNARKTGSMTMVGH
jgi:hypothetical protein